MTFRSPVRRKTRQRSGFNVAGDTPGSECKLKKSGRLMIKDNYFEITFLKKEVIVQPLFKNEIGILCFGAYIKPKLNLQINMSLEFKIDNHLETISKIMNINAGRWNKIGILAEINITKPKEIDPIECKLKIESQKEDIGIIDFFGINLGAIESSPKDYLKKNKVKDLFFENINIYIPEVFYLNYDQIQHVVSKRPIAFDEGEAIVIKSCNRCSRFLPIDVLNERNTLSFNNHCVKTPCKHKEHKAFSDYAITEMDYTIPPKEINGFIKDKRLKLYNGFQLECKPCKKFFVNTPLNPLRNSTQHREDSLRRRAIERLIDQLLKRKYIYHKFRLEQQKEFDKYIWEKFGKKCFKCGITLKNEREMDLDHTMPLASFWPLDETATCLCKNCNSHKHDRFPIEFYSKQKLKELSKLTNLPLKRLQQKVINEEVVEKLISRVEWFFDKFLNDEEYQKVRAGKRTSDLIYKAIAKQIYSFYGPRLNLVEIYKKKTEKFPKTITF